jgi:hypothetical protein
MAGLAMSLLPTMPTQAAQAESLFNVTVRQRVNPDRDSVFCRVANAPGSQGALVTLVCSTGVPVALAPGLMGQPLSPMHGGAHLFVTRLSAAGELPVMLDAYTGAGTVTGWRNVQLNDWPYLELTVGW